MSTDRDARRAARRKATHRRVEPEAPPAGETALRSKPVRITIDLTPELYRRLNRWTQEAAEEIDAAKLPLAEVVRAMVRAAEDPSVRDRILSELRAGRS
jgi:hypothetical protein